MLGVATYGNDCHLGLIHGVICNEILGIIFEKSEKRHWTQTLVYRNIKMAGNDLTPVLHFR